MSRENLKLVIRVNREMVEIVEPSSNSKRDIIHWSNQRFAYRHFISYLRKHANEPVLIVIAKYLRDVDDIICEAKNEDMIDMLLMAEDIAESFEEKLSTENICIVPWEE